MGFVQLKFTSTKVDIQSAQLDKGVDIDEIDIKLRLSFIWLIFTTIRHLAPRKKLLIVDGLRQVLKILLLWV